MKNPTKASLKQNNLAPHKRFGQNFLVNEYTSRAIVNCGDFSSEDAVIEIGVGLAALTNIIAERARKVIGIEIDSGIIKYHQNNATLAPNIELLHQDVLKSDFPDLASQCGHRLKIIANLPYSISNPFIFKVIENRESVDWVVVMLQKEMAERLIAQPSTKQYGIPTVLLGGYAQVKKLFVVKPHEFHPQPKIDSMVIRIDFQKNAPLFDDLPDTLHSIFQQVVRTSFSQRRKTLSNNLVALPVIRQQISQREQQKEFLAKVFNSAEISSSERAENLTVQDFARLTREIWQLLPQTPEAPLLA